MFYMYVYMHVYVKHCSKNVVCVFNTCVLRGKHVLVIVDTLFSMYQSYLLLVYDVLHLIAHCSCQLAILIIFRSCQGLLHMYTCIYMHISQGTVVPCI